MKINPHIIKSYDIRGVYPSEINEESAFKIGQAFVAHTSARKIALGRDGRISSPALYRALTKGITSQGCDVYSIGEVPTEGMYFTAVNYGYDAGIMVTASHNPKEYNGFKMIKKTESGIFDVVRGSDLAKIVEGNFKDNEIFGEVKDLNFWPDYVSHVLSFVDLEKISPLKVVVDASNGMAGKAVQMIKDSLLAEIIPLNFNIDGNFPAHEPNPLSENSRKQISSEVIGKRADFGVIFDGDGDRVYLIDERGQSVRGDIAFLLLVRHFLKKYPGKGVAYNLICSKAVPETIGKMGGIPIKTKVGYVNVSRGLIQNDGVVSGEISGHYSFKDNYYFDSGIIAFLVFLQIISESGKKLSEILEDFPHYAISEEQNFKVGDKKAILDKAKKKYSRGKQDFLDGITVEYRDWWFNLRPSNTEPLLRLTVEADNKIILKKKIKELTDFVKSF
ncbi:MAG: phosphomannomutase/phosphoglucomutase [bacterium]|nr:phosphomannomutase/phosphoglucomutase [bacterium]